MRRADMSRQGYRIFVDELARFATEAADLPLAAITRRVAAPLRVAVRGRRGAGRRTVARALAGAGIEVTRQPEAADLDVYVIAEVVKPEDRDAIREARRPVLAVLNKADLTGPITGDAAGEPLAAARTRCARYSALTGAPTEPMVGILAVAALDGLPDTDLWAALRVLAAQTLGAAVDCPEDVAAGRHGVAPEVGRRLLDTLDLFGIAHAVVAVWQGRPVAEVRAMLRFISCIDTVVDRLAAAGSEVHYRRVLDAIAELETLAVTDRRIGEFLSRDETVLARMAAAVEVVESAGLTVGACHDQDACLQRALRWQRYSRARVGAVQRACGADIARGSLRLWSRAGVSQ